MKHFSQRIAAGLAGLVAAHLPVHAGDMMNGAAGGIKDYGSAGIAVPAPVPYEETFKWYVRGDIGTAFKNSGKFETGGLTAPQITQPGNWSEQSIVSFGFGRYLTPSVRGEFTVDYRTPKSIASGVRALPDISITRAVPGTSAFNIYSGVQDENISYQNTTFLLNGFYDFNHGGRLHPFVGAGIGLAMHQLRRAGADTFDCFDGGITVINTPPTPNAFTPGCNTVNGLQTHIVSASSSNRIGYGLAAQLSAGVTYDITARTHWDTGYRALWQSGRVGVVSSDGLSSVHVGDRLEHELRTGVRWDLW